MAQAAPGRTDYTVFYSSDLALCLMIPSSVLQDPQLLPDLQIRIDARMFFSFLVVKKTIFSTDGCELALTIQAFSIFILNNFIIFLYRAMLSRAYGKVNNEKTS